VKQKKIETHKIGLVGQAPSRRGDPRKPLAGPNGQKIARLAGISHEGRVETGVLLLADSLPQHFVTRLPRRDPSHLFNLPLSWQIGFAGIDRGGNDLIPPPSK
jgi:hypothetical protein